MKWVGGAPMSTASKVFVGLFVSLFFLCFAAKWMQSLQVAALLILPAGIVMVVSGWLDGRRYRRRLTQRLEAFRARHEVLEGRSDVVREREKPQGRYERYVKMSEFLLTRICFPLWFVGIAIIAIMAFSGVSKQWLGFAGQILLVLVIGSWLGLNGVGMVWGTLRRESCESSSRGGLLHRAMWLMFFATGVVFIGILIYFLVLIVR